MSDIDLGIDKFFELEKTITFKLARLLNDVNVLQRKVLPNVVDISPFIAKVSNAFLPQVVYQLEEYGLPRMISRKIDQSKVFNFTDNELPLHETIRKLKEIGYDRTSKEVESLDDFDKYILEYFFDGI
jgi:hypothetical protein